MIRTVMKAGDVVEGKYELVRPMGHGGMGEVWEARHTRIGLQVALKFLRSDLAASEEASRRFLREAQAAAAIGSDHIVSVTDVGETAETGPFIVMEYLVGEDLSDLLDRLGPLEVGRAVRLTTQVCRGLGAAHQRGIIHRDLKPDNLILTRRDDGAEWIKVLDFGIAKVRESLAAAQPSTQLTATGSTMGTPHYMAPEQAWGSKDIDHRADQYSTGVLLYELLTRQKPFEAESYNELIIRVATTEPTPPSTHRPDLPAALEGVMLKAMAKDREDRFSSMAAFAEALVPFRGAAFERAGEVAVATRGGGGGPPASGPAAMPAASLGAAATVAAPTPAEGTAGAADIGTDPTLLPLEGPPPAGAMSDGAGGSAPEEAQAPSRGIASPAHADVGGTDAPRSDSAGLPGSAPSSPPSSPPSSVVTQARHTGGSRLWIWVLAGLALLTTCVVGGPMVLCAGILGSAQRAGPPEVVIDHGGLAGADAGPATVTLESSGGAISLGEVPGSEGQPVGQITLTGKDGHSLVLTEPEEEGRVKQHPRPRMPMRPPDEVGPPSEPPPAPAAPLPAKQRDANRLAKAFHCNMTGDFQCCARELSGWQGNFAGTKLLHRCLERSGKTREACQIARRHPLRFRKALARCR